MLFTETEIAGVYVIDLKRLDDDRGWFARSFCTDEFAAHGIDPDVVQCNVSYSNREGTIRGLHYQAPPSAEGKLVRCTSGAIYDVAVDIRPDSPTYLHHVAVELTAENRSALFVPKLFAHGFQTLHDGTEVFYQMTFAYDPAAGAGLRYDDPKLGIAWPLPVSEISDRDAALPLL
jgi:dTDP-4-dehydrorhamnose 3,5-epimerase